MSILYFVYGKVIPVETRSNFNRGHVAEALEDRQLGAHIHIYQFTDCKNNDFKVLSSKKLIAQNTYNYVNMLAYGS